MKIDLSQYTTKQERLKYLIANKRDILELKKSELKHSDILSFENIDTETAKALRTEFDDQKYTNLITRKIIGNTYNWMDSHYDVHLNGIFAKSISERKDKIWHLHDHEHKVSSKVGKFIELKEEDVEWIELGVNKIGKTQALVGVSEINKEWNSAIYKQYLKGEINQHSVGMIYVKIEMAIEDPEDKEGYANWLKYLPILGNQEKAMESGFFFVVKEAKLIEISAVLEGSNELTQTYTNVTPKTDTVEPIEKEESIYEFLIKNLKLQ